MFASVTYLALVNSLRLPLLVTVKGGLAYHIRQGHYGETSLDGLNALALGAFKGNIWAGETKINLGFFFDERADLRQREALQMIFSGKAGGFMAELAKLIGEVRGFEFAPIKFEVADDLAYWSAEIPGKVVARGEALTGPMTPPGKRVQTINPPGSEVGPGVVATWGTAVTDELKEWVSSGKEVASLASTFPLTGVDLKVFVWYQV